jgi:hypothetical protein
VRAKESGHVAVLVRLNIGIQIVASSIKEHRNLDPNLAGVAKRHLAQ